MMKERDIVIIGGGSAGMAAALAAKENGIDDIVILERESELGGILQQCIHNGFGLQIFKEELSGPAFAQRLMDRIRREQIDYRLNTSVVTLTKDRKITYVNPKEGYTEITAKAIILACGCYERSRGAISIPGTRPKGIYTAGTAQKYLNIENILVGKNIFILGSGDIGLIMARRMTLEGAKVHGVAELMPYSNGLMRNIVQCLQDFDIPLYLSHTVTAIRGKDHLEEVEISQVDEQHHIIPGTAKSFAVDTLLLSVGLIPDSSLAYDAGIELDLSTKGAIVNERFETSVPGIYACGNALHVHDLVDYVTMEAQAAGSYAAEDLQEPNRKQKLVEVAAGEGINGVVPQRVNVHAKEDAVFSFRSREVHGPCVIEISDDEKQIKTIYRRYLLPAEMERFTLKREDINRIHGKLKIGVRDQHD